MAWPPSLLEQVSETSAIAHLNLVGDVGTTKESLLRRLLSHCTPEQLEHIETSTKGRDLSCITDELWRQHYSRRFGKDHADMVHWQQQMTTGGRTFKWSRLYRTKMREQEELQIEGVDRLRELYKQQNTRRTSRQIQPLDMDPPAGSKRAKTAALPPSGGSSGGSERSKVPANSKVPPAVAGRTGKGHIDEEGRKKVAGSEKGRLMKKSRWDFARRNKMMRPRWSGSLNRVNKGINQRPGVLDRPAEN